MTENILKKSPYEGKSFETPHIIKMGQSTVSDIKKYIIINKNDVLLDFGAGTGLVGLGFINDVKKVIFLEPSKDMTSYLKEKIDLLKIKNYEIFEGYIENFNQKNFDIITAGMVLHHIVDIDKLFKIIFDLLNSKGYFCFTDAYKDSPLFSFPGREHLPHKGFIPEELSEKLKLAGFMNIEIKQTESIIFPKDPNKSENKRFLIIAQKP